MAAAHQPHRFRRRQVRHLADDLSHPGPRRVHQHPGPEAAPVGQLDGPAVALAPGLGHAGADDDVGAARRRVARVQHHQPRIVHPAVGIFIGPRQPVLQRRALGRVAQVQRGGARQDLARTEVVVKEQSRADHQVRTMAARPGHRHRQKPRNRRLPGKAHLRVQRQDKAHGPGDVRHGAQQHLALAQRLAHQTEFQELEIAQPAVEQLGRGAAGGACKVALFRKADGQTAARGIAGQPGAVDPPTNDEQIRRRRHGRSSLPAANRTSRRAFCQHGCSFLRSFFRLTSDGRALLLDGQVRAGG